MSYQIEEVKSYFHGEGEEEDDEEDEFPTAALSFNVKTGITRHDLIASLPPRLVVDQLLSKYFNSNSPTLRKWKLLLMMFVVFLPCDSLTSNLDILHGPTFQKEVRTFHYLTNYHFYSRDALC